MDVIIDRADFGYIDRRSQCVLDTFLKHCLRFSTVMAFAAEKDKLYFVAVNLLLQENLLGGRVIKKSACIKWFMHALTIPHSALNYDYFPKPTSMAPPAISRPPKNVVSVTFSLRNIAASMMVMTKLSLSIGATCEAFPICNARK